MLWGAALAVLLPAAALAGAVPEEANDSVHLVDNSQTNVKIVEDDWKGVKVTRANVEIPMAVNRVRTTEYSDRVTQYDQGLEALRKQDYPKAVSLLAAGMKKTRDLKQRQYFQVALIECYEGQKRPEEMRKQIRKMVDPARRNPKKAPRLIYDAYLKLGRSLLLEGKYSKAEGAFGEAYDFFKKLEELARKKETKALAGVIDYVKGYRLKAGYWKIFSMEQQGKAKIEGHRGARRAYDLFAFEATGHLRLVNMAKIGRARCDAKLGKTDSALKALKEMEKDLSDPKKLAKAGAGAVPAVYVALGDVYFLKLDYRNARWYYLTVIVQHSTDRAMVARAHYMAGRCYEALRKTVREREAIPRALRHYTIVTKEYQDSLEYVKAKDRQRELKAQMGA
jgi:tetratricopeptide (TPR) repeat protein